MLFLNRLNLVQLIALYTLIACGLLACDEDLCDDSGAGGEDNADDYYGTSEEGGEEFEECDESDTGGDTGDTTTDQDLPGNAYQYIVIVDNSLDFNEFGTPGADLCDVVVNCGENVPVFDFQQEPGSSPVCSDSNPTLCICEYQVAGICGGVDRHNPLAIENQLSCNGDDVNNQSPYYSLGLGGVLILDYDQDLSGCFVSVTERQGDDQEGYKVYACTEPNFSPIKSDDCVALGTSDSQGEVDRAVP